MAHTGLTEEQLSEEYRKSIEYQLQLKKDELKAHKESKPKEVTKPDTDPKKKEEIEQTSKKIEQKLKEIKALKKTVTTLTDEEKIQTRPILKNISKH